MRGALIFGGVVLGVLLAIGGMVHASPGIGSLSGGLPSTYSGDFTSSSDFIATDCFKLSGSHQYCTSGAEIALFKNSSGTERMWLDFAGSNVTFTSRGASDGTADFIWDTANTQTANVYEWEMADTNLLTLDKDGDGVFTGTATADDFITTQGALGAVYSDSGGFVANGTDRSAELSGKKATGAAAIGVKLQNQVDLTTEGARPVVIYKDLGTTEVWSVNQKGKVKLTTGASGCSGTATLVGGTVTVSTTCVKTSDVIMLTANTPGGTAGILSAPVASITDATSFVINSSSGTDTSTVNWFVFDN